MKRSFTLFLLLCILSAANAQITLNEGNTPHSPDFTEVRFVTVNPAVDLNLEGENIDYDFGSIPPELMFTDTFLPPTRPEFADATRFDLGSSSLGPLFFTGENYTRKDSTGIARLGNYKVAETLSMAPLTGNPDDVLEFPGNNSRFDEPNYELLYPVTYGSTWSSSAVYTSDYNLTIGAFGLNAVPGQNIQYADFQYEVAGWGQATLPTLDGPTIPYDVLSVKQTVTLVDSFFLAGGPAPAPLLNALGVQQGAQTIQNIYQLYAEGFETPILLLLMSADWQTIEEVQYPRDGLVLNSPYTYVDADATGANNGRSWANAYTSLSTALDNASPDEEIWVAEGTYVPGVPAVSPDPNKRMFLLWQDVQLYGGFNGTETERSQRNPVIHETILSGDVNGDDVINDFATNRSDNLVNVVFGNNTISTACVLDGFVISGGQADGNPGILTDVRGGGLFSFGPLQLNRCLFEQNYSAVHGGGAYYRDAEADGAKVTNCRFTRNRAVENGGGLFSAFLTGQGMEVDSCVFTENIAGDSGGGFIVVRSHCTLANSTFSKNSATFGSGGGATLSNLLDGVVSNCTFSENSGNQGAGAVIGLLSPGQSLLVENCRFIGNTGIVSGGMSCQLSEPNAEVTIDECTFVGNTADSPFSTGAGLDVAIGNFASEGSAVISNCTIMNNSTTGSGGGMALRDQAGDHQLEIRNCQITGNSADLNAGGLLFYKATDSNTSLHISQTSFANNQSPQALGIGMVSVASFLPALDIAVDNCVFTGHSGPNNASAAVLVQNLPVGLTNCTVTGASPALIAADAAAMTLQNNLLYTPDFTSVLAATASSTFTSLGGNLFSDAAPAAWAAAEDQQDADPLFVSGTTQLTAGSPAVDRGILPDDAPELDVIGNARVQGSCIDIGAQESAFDADLESCLTLTSTKEQVVSAAGLKIYPNPVQTTGHIQLENDWRGRVQITVVNAMGQSISAYAVDKQADSDLWELDLPILSNGMYHLLLSNGNQMMAKRFVVAQ